MRASFLKLAEKRTSKKEKLEELWAPQAVNTDYRHLGTFGRQSKSIPEIESKRMSRDSDGLFRDDYNIRARTKAAL